MHLSRSPPLSRCLPVPAVGPVPGPVGVDANLPASCRAAPPPPPAATAGLSTAPLLITRRATSHAAAAPTAAAPAPAAAVPPAAAPAAAAPAAAAMVAITRGEVTMASRVSVKATLRCALPPVRVATGMAARGAARRQNCAPWTNHCRPRKSLRAPCRKVSRVTTNKTCAHLFLRTVRTNVACFSTSKTHPRRVMAGLT